MTIDDLTPFTGTTPDKDTQSAETFDENMQDWVDYITPLPVDINTFISQLSSEINTFALNIEGATVTVSIYSAGTTYGAGEIVIDPNDNYRMYTSQQGSNSGHTPSSDNGTWWRVTFGQMSGTNTHSSSTGVTLTSASKQVQNVTMTAADKFVSLPNATSIREGANTFVFFNNGDYRFGVQDYSGNFICSIQAHSNGRVHLSDNSTVAGTWKATDGADLIMNRIKTVCNSDSSTAAPVTSCKLTSTEVFVAWTGSGDDGFCAVLTWDSTTPEITISNILEFETTYADKLSACRMSDTVAIVAYKNADADGYCAAITYDGTNTLSVTDTYEFKDAVTIGDIKIVPIYENSSAGKFCVFYTTTSPNLEAQVLNWTGSAITSNTSATLIRNGVSTSYLSADLISGDLSSANMLIGYVYSNTFYVKRVVWNGTTLTPHAASGGDGFNVESAIATYNSMVAIDENYFVSFAYRYTTSTYYNELSCQLLYWTGSTFEIKKQIQLCSSRHGFSFSSESAKLTDDNSILFSLRSEPTTKLYKIKAIGATSAKDCVLFVESEMDIGVSGTGIYFTNSVLDSSSVFHIYKDVQDSDYLTAQHIDIG